MCHSEGSDFPRNPAHFSLPKRSPKRQRRFCVGSGSFPTEKSPRRLSGVHFLCEHVADRNRATPRASPPKRAKGERSTGYLITGSQAASLRRPVDRYLRCQPHQPLGGELIRDTDGAFGEAFTRRLRAMGIRDRPIAPRSPWQNGYVERSIRSIRRECLEISRA
jgi:hypothetical protein